MRQIIEAIIRGKVKLKLALPDKVHLIHKGEHFFHMSYLGAVGWEAHGLYRWFALALLLTIILGIFIKEELQ